MDNTIKLETVTKTVTDRRRETKESPGLRIKELTKGQSVVLEKTSGGGSLEARRLVSGGVQFYWRYTVDKRTERVSIGLYDSAAPPRSLSPTNRGYSVAAALERARDLAKLNKETPGGLRAARERQAQAERAAADARISQEKHSLKSLCLDYCEWLKRQGKPSHSEARGLFVNHLFNAFPETAAKPAALVEKREIVTVVRGLTAAGKSATARKLRSYLRAAYACAVKSDSDAALPSSFTGFAVLTNPVEATVAIRGATDKNPLPASELRKYWRELLNEESVIGAALRLHVLTGGQRPAQLARLRAVEDVSWETIRLLDPKGKRTEAREHLIPVTRQIKAELKNLSPTGFVLSTDGGKTHMHSSSLSNWAAEIGKRAEIKEFRLKRVRSGIETMLASARIDKQTRGQLQSHGIGGVQDTHYDAHTYLPEKRRALQTLYRMLGLPP